MKPLAWKALKQLRATRTNRDLAREALGPKASAKSVNILANKFSRIINGHVPKISVRFMIELASGFGFDSLSQFFCEWESTTAQLYPTSAKLLAAVAQQNGVQQQAEFLVHPTRSTAITSGTRKELRGGPGVYVDDQAHTIRALLVAHEAIGAQLRAQSIRAHAEGEALVQVIGQIQRILEGVGTVDPDTIARQLVAVPGGLTGPTPEIQRRVRRRIRRQ